MDDATGAPSNKRARASQEGVCVWEGVAQLCCPGNGQGLSLCTLLRKPGNGEMVRSRYKDTTL